MSQFYKGQFSAYNRTLQRPELLKGWIYINLAVCRSWKTKWGIPYKRLYSVHHIPSGGLILGSLFFEKRKDAMIFVKELYTFPDYLRNIFGKEGLVWYKESLQEVAYVNGLPVQVVVAIIDLLGRVNNRYEHN